MQKTTQIQGFTKINLVLILAFMSSIAPLSTDMYLPALSEVQKTFETNSFFTQVSLAVFFIAFSLGQLIYGPLSDAYGRKKPLYFGISLFIVSSLICVLVDSIHIFITFRFFEALGGCAGVVIARAIVNDKFELKEAASMFALMMVVSSLAPMISPIFGGFLLDYFSWRSIFALLFGLGIVLFLWIVFGLQESNCNPKPIGGLKNYFLELLLILKDRRFRIYVFSSGFAMATLFAYITGSSYLFREFFGLSEKDFGVLFGINALSLMIFAQINAKIVLKYSPYFILPYAFLAIFGISLLLIIVGFLQLHFIVFEILLFLNLGALGFIVPNTTTLAMSRFKQNGGSASALLGTIQFALAGGISFLVGIIGANKPLPLALIIASCLIIACGIYFSLNKREVRNLKRKLGLK